MSTAEADSDTYNVVIVPTVEVPPRPERPLPNPTFSRCTLETTQDGDEMLEMIVEPRRNLRFERSIMEALYGNILLATEVKVEGSRYVEVNDEEGNVRQFAVKRMPWEKITKNRGSMAEDPLNEIAALGIASNPGHPNVLQLEAALSDGETAFLITPFVGGGEMFDWVRSKKGLNVGKRIEITQPLFRQLIKGIMYIHSKGICHADISLENILIDRKGERLYIIDFGMSFLMPINGDNRRHMSVPDRRTAKTSYCSPETLKKKDYDGVKVDVFAAGAVLFMMLTGKPPFATASRRDRRFKKLVYHGDVEGVISQLGVSPIGDQAVDLLKKMMAYRPEDRPLPEQVLQHPWLAS